MGLALGVLCGLGWTTAYVLAIRAGLRDRTYAIPVVALATNISWEFQFAFVRPATEPSDWPRTVINIVWFLLDCGLLYTVVRFGPREFPRLRPHVFRGFLVLLLALAYTGMDVVSMQLDGGLGVFTAFGSNVAMSGMFLAMLAARGDSRGQSLGIAAAKLVGTAAASLDWYVERARYPGTVVPYCAVACFLLDVAYLLTLAAVIRREKDGRSGAETPRRDGAAPEPAA
ncbi:hypothetical protein [Streptomyces sp. I05A-00742]|uniref:transmembrane-type terpene cyclase n=1 Tax=Streptomyces sp. I05A-00742 TaxID=2732853 RepID=UPI001BB2AAA0|nr:hypothetical protein [Streptomyces sp. I05A-00742]